MEDNTQNFKELQPGTGLNGGKYVIEKKIGEGGFGITYKAVQQGLNRPVCIKEYFLAGRCVRNTLARTVQLQGISEELFEKYRQSFVHEAQTLAALHHQGIVEVIDVFDENNTSYMVMPFIEGRSLQSIVEENGPLPYSDAVNYLTQIANAVDYIHQRHILHRDIKPENIMITADYKAILIDFGSARQFEEDKTQSHTAMLTHGYAPTEQYTRNSRKGAYTDIYSIGATLYFILTGQVPMEAAARIVEPMPEPKQLNPSLPDEANSTILKAMQLKPADRYQSVQELLNDLLNKNNPQQNTQTATPPPIPKTTPTPPTPQTP
ncbi:MAG: serine/threonine protein kinase, partial [Bacteroidales bacterium]|nr:serine/threonine protein kinase [Bacteroidales bacterium]